ncbi:MAG: Ca-activated chloride channel family protein [Flavobacteriaceae bacterium]|jgi:Ca-activated chloride channel family protein
MLTNWNIRFWEYEFFSSGWLWLMCAVPVVLFIIYRLERNRKGEVKYSRTIKDQKSIGSRWIVYVRDLNLLLYGIIACLLIFGMAKPYNEADYDGSDNDFKDGIDIVIAMDVSGSMLAMDFLPNRLEAAKKVAKEFVDGRKGDRIGLVAYAGEAFTACPPTLDYAVLKKQIDQINGDYIEGGTAIGIGLGTAVTRLRSDSIKSKVIILLTDGQDGGSEISPIMAAELAKSKNIRVYTIGVGSTGESQSPGNGPFGINFQPLEAEIDEVTLKEIAKITDGQYFRATDEESLREIYAEIEKLEKRKMEDNHFKSEPPSNPMAFLNWAFVLALISWSLNYLVFKTNE